MSDESVSRSLYLQALEEAQNLAFMNKKVQRDYATLKRSVESMSDDDPAAADVKELLELWRDVVKGGNKNVKADLKSTRAPKVKAALKRRGKEMCRKAILGIVHDDWAMGRIHKSQGKSFNDIAEHILNTDGDIEKWADMYDRHEAKKVVSIVPPQPDPETWDTVQNWRRTSPITKVIGSFGADNWPVPAVNDPDRWSARCPAHDDHNPSLSISRSATGNVLLKCWAGCETEAILDALGLSWGHLFEDNQWDGDCVESVYRGDPRKLRPLPAEDIALLRQCQSVIARSERRAA